MTNLGVGAGEPLCTRVVGALAMGINTFCLSPTVLGLCIWATTDGDEELKMGVAVREAVVLLKETNMLAASILAKSASPGCLVGGPPPTMAVTVAAADRLGLRKKLEVEGEEWNTFPFKLKCLEQ